MAEENIEQEGLLDVEETINKSEEFIENNKNTILYVVAGIAVILLGYMYYTRTYLPERELLASEDMYQAEKYFEKDSFNLALNGLDEDGFLYITEEYGATQSGNLANYYAGLCYLKLGEFEEAIDYLKSYDGGDIMTSSIANGAIGDAYVELEDLEEGVSYYEKAAAINPNNFTSPIYLMKAGEVLEVLEQYENAVEVYETIKKDYSKSVEASKVDKYIARAKARI